MSLILEALRKLEREKQSPDAGLVVVGHTPWTGGSPGSSRPVLIALVVALVASGIGFGVWLGRAPAPVSLASSAPSVAPTSRPLESVATTAPTPVPSVPGATLESALPVPPQTTIPSQSAPRPGTVPRATPGMPVTPTTLPVGALPPMTGNDRTPARAESAPARTPAAPLVYAEREVDQEAPAAAPASRGELKLQAISQRDGHPIAVINERLVREGESFDGVLVVRIGKAEVEVEVGGRRRTLIF